MRSAILAALLASALLTTACGREEDTPPPSRASLERAQPQQADAPPRQAQEAPRAQMPAAEALTDPAITARITAALEADPAMKGADVSINTDRGVVVLSGKVASQEQIGVASAHAQRQDGVLRVDNHLRPEFS